KNPMGSLLVGSAEKYAICCKPCHFFMQTPTIHGGRPIVAPRQARYTATRPLTTKAGVIDEPRKRCVRRTVGTVGIMRQVHLMKLAVAGIDAQQLALQGGTEAENELEHLQRL